jgi:hypothetical protein
MECASVWFAIALLISLMIPIMIFGSLSAHTVHGATGSTRVSSCSSGCASIRHAHSAPRCYLCWAVSARLSGTGLKMEPRTNGNGVRTRLLSFQASVCVTGPFPGTLSLQRFCAATLSRAFVSLKKTGHAP